MSGQQQVRRRLLGNVDGGRLVDGPRSFRLFQGDDPACQRPLDLTSLTGQRVRVRGFVSGDAVYQAEVAPAGSRVPRLPRLSPRRLRAMAKAARALAERLTPEGILGVGVGFRRRRGWQTREPCLQARVARKHGQPAFMIQPDFGGYPIDVVEGVPRRGRAGCFEADTFKRFTKLGGGQPIRIGAAREVSTLGILIQLDGQIYGLTTAHSFAGQPPGVPVYQARNAPGEQIGTLAARRRSVGMDAALIAIRTTRELRRGLHGALAPRVRGFGAPCSEHPRVRKVGARTGHARGRITAWESTQRFEDGSVLAGLLEISSPDGGCVANEGDSGSVWVDERGLVVALTVGVLDTRTTAFALPIERVQAAFEGTFQQLP